MFPLGVCNFNNKYCGCQTYKEDENNPEKCYYCHHYNAFHTGFSPAPHNTSTPLLGACQKDGNTSPSIVPGSINIESNLPSYILTSSINNSEDSRSWENNSAPRENTSAWVEMRDNGFIIENVLFNENTSEAINDLITRSFPSVNEDNWILLNAGSASKLKIATCQEKSLKNFRENMSKSNKRLYLTLTSDKSSEAEADNNQDEYSEIKSENTD
ncbi:unnamed protein product [Rhizophagus irregularis]|uniref:Uncharacterized protein n=1 Tax=Rhizophagus irregularis TaxID=588596 RepID=A0A915ZLW2_9GLOM|nr:unnamed protein product [Rhizophagus irregularis]